MSVADEAREAIESGMDASEMIRIMQYRRDKARMAAEQLDKLYDDAVKFFKAVEAGSDSDKGCQWLREQLAKTEDYIKEDRQWYNHHATNTCIMVDDWLRVKRT